MKIWFPTIAAGSGADVYVDRLAGALRKHGLQAEITWFDRRFEFTPFLLAGKHPPRGTDIIHANSWNAFAFRKKHIPLVVTEHHCVLDPEFRRHKSSLQHLYHQHLVRRYEQSSFNHADRIVAVSNYTKASLQKVFGITDVRVIYNWVDTDIFRPGKPAANSGKKLRLLFVGNRSARKGWDTARRVIENLDGDYELAATSGLDERHRADHAGNIKPLGRLDTAGLVRAYQECDALLFPSRYEGFGYVALEAMACGKPVIAASNSALPELVSDNECGLLCPPDDIDCFVSACKRMANEPALCTRLGNNARQRSLKTFSSEELIRKYIAMYR
ncbi:MAG: glycosyltransferase family 4 protein, partial [Thiogranum sp.]